MHHNRQASYFIAAHPTPPALPQILAVFAAAGHVPARARSRMLGRQLQVEVSIASLTDGEAEQLAGQLRSCPTVVSVRVEQVELHHAA